ncbi:hypothetical protein COU37_03210 [Candidatus Micrarchaeota archaeon CG10_big_fil_rev_8_21_14_0_10_45_29]|nr:MAG: hypothetical protein COU37_03210 [Candidatus Micrarchaeota archaeon CG10_big_fil_rev_8_21_14_0_10_45_29]
MVRKVEAISSYMEGHSSNFHYPFPLNMKNAPSKFDDLLQKQMQNFKKRNKEKKDSLDLSHNCKKMQKLEKLVCEFCEGESSFSLKEKKEILQKIKDLISQLPSSGSEAIKEMLNSHSNLELYSIFLNSAPPEAKPLTYPQEIAKFASSFRRN